MFLDERRKVSIFDFQSVLRRDIAIVDPDCKSVPARPIQQSLLRALAWQSRDASAPAVVPKPQVRTPRVLWKVPLKAPSFGSAPHACGKGTRLLPCSSLPTAERVESHL